jgi:subtilisin-like proprotein convertase family protein
MKHSIFRFKRSLTTVLAFAAVALAMWFALHDVAQSLAAAKSEPAAQIKGASKEEMTSRLNELDAMIDQLKSQLAENPKDPLIRAQLDAAVTEYDALSEQMGGDRASGQGESSERRAPASPNTAPAPPPGCTATQTTFTNTTPLPIPTGPAVVSSTIVVAGAGTFLSDVDLQTFITHTFAADLDITLQSPAGTIVTITTDNGSSNDNVFNGTTWDDDANPGGQVPYTTNSGVVTDHAYTNLVVATPLVPEEAMGAFIGEDPNGTWTITISDDLAGDGGSLDQWALILTTLSSVPAFTSGAFTNSTPVAIPTGPAVVTSTLGVAGADTYLSDLDVVLNITHTFAADLDITLQSPAGTVVTLTTDNGGGNDDVFNGTTWDDDANPSGQVPYTSNNGLTTDQTYTNLVVATPLVPEEAMAAFIGEDPNGTWTITISDDLAGDGGSLNSWTLNITTASCAAVCTITCPANVTQSNDPGQCAAVVNYPAPAADPGCGTVTCSPASGSFFPVGTTTVTCTTTAGPSCSFTVTVNDTEPPVITCPPSQTACATPGSMGTVVNYPTPVPSDNCPGATVACVPPSGSTLPPGTTTVTCTATDAAGNTASCSFTIDVFDALIQDDYNSLIRLMWITRGTQRGQYLFCCSGSTFTGIGTAVTTGNTYTLTHSPVDRRVVGRLEANLNRGNGSLQLPPGKILCTIVDRNTSDDLCGCTIPNGLPMRKGP